MSERTFPYRRVQLLDHHFGQIVSNEVYALERCHDLISAALEHDARRRWWQRPDRLWVGRMESALRMLNAALPPVDARDKETP